MSKKSEFSVYAEIWYLDEFKYSEFNGHVHIFCLSLETLFLGKFDLKKKKKNQNCQFNSFPTKSRRQRLFGFCADAHEPFRTAFMTMS